MEKKTEKMNGLRLLYALGAQQNASYQGPDGPNHQVYGK